MKIRAILAGLTLAVGTLAYVSTHQSNVSFGGPPTPVCQPDAPDCLK